ncbi:MAG: hypothetical protein DKINENOH_01669 [bacterium]|nr:hypothetical protein [bacterium]
MEPRFQSVLNLKAQAGTVALLIVLILLPQNLVAQPCDPTRAQVTGSVTVGDGSTPTGPNFSLWFSLPGGGGYGAKMGSFPWGTATLEPYWAYNEGAFTAAGDGPYQRPPGSGYFRCKRDAQSCRECTGHFDIKLYAVFGNFSGFVTLIPENVPPPTGTIVNAKPNHTTRTEADGSFIFAPYEGRPYWSIRVSGDGTAPLSGTYRLGVAGGRPEDDVEATTYSSQIINVNLVKRSPYMEEPSTRSCPALGYPISVVTGNMFLDQIDIALPALGPDLKFIRSYNSQLAYRRIAGGFGPGWSHPYEQSLSFPSIGIIMLRQGDGVPSYFQDMDANLTYDASVPFTKESWIEKQADGTYTRRLRMGGYETYDSAGQLTSMVDANGNATILGRDGSGRLTSISASGSRSLTLTYTTSNRIATLSGPAGLIATYAYDSSRRLHKVAYPDSSGYTFSYDSNNQLLTVSNPYGKVLETHTYSGNKAITSELSEGREKYTISYSPLKTTVTDTLGNVATYEWTNIWGSKYVTKIMGPCPSCGTGQSETHEWTYDHRGRMLSYKDGNGNIMKHTYNADGDLVSDTNALEQTTTYTYDTQGRRLTQTGPLGDVTSWTHGPAGPLIITDPLNRTTRTTYDAKGNPIAITDPRGMTTTMAYDTVGNLSAMTDPLGNTTTLEYDVLNRRTAITDALDNATTTSYDARGRVVRTTNPDGTHTDYAYDLDGRQTKVTDPLVHPTSYAYDPYGRLETSTDPLNGTTKYGYDLMSNLTSLTDARGKVTTFAYDGYGRVTKVVYPGERSETFTYDSAGRLLTKTDRTGVVTTFTYNAMNQLTGKTFSDRTPPVTFGYDSAGRLVSAVNTSDTLTWTYDSAGQIIAESSTGNTITISYTYDPAGNRVSVSLNGTLYLAYAYDGANRLVKINRGSSDYAFGYDKLSRRILLRFPNGATTGYAYDPLSRLTNVKTVGRRRFLWLSFGYVIEQIDYTYDAAGNRLSKTTTASKEAYTYDPLYRLTAAQRGNTKTEAYTYDAVGNRLSSLTNSDWTYSNRNELLSHSGASFAYDPNGNLTHKAEDGIAWTYEWNAENQLARVLRDGVEVARFSYDPMGRRVEKVVGGLSKLYTYDYEDIIREQSAASTFRYTHGDGIDEPLAIENMAGVISFYHADALGSIIKTTNRSSKVTSSYRYGSFGNIEIGAHPGGYAFTGREWEPEIGLYYYRARYYDPRIGRFISEDPISFLAQVNLYAYVLNRPTIAVDPSGFRHCYRFHLDGRVVCLPDPQPCVDQGWCDEIPDPWADPNCYQNCLNASNPPWLSYMSNLSTIYGSGVLGKAAGKRAATAVSVGIASYQLTLPLICKLICQPNVCGR